MGLMAGVSGKQGASGVQGRLGGVRRGGKAQKGKAGPSYLHPRCLHPPGKAGAGREEVGVSVRPPAPPPLSLPCLIQVKPPGRRRSPRWRVVASSSAFCQGALGQRTSGPQLPEPDHPQACSWLWGRGPAPASHNGLEEFHSFPWGQRASLGRVVFADLPRDMGSPLSQDQGSPSLKTAWCPPHRCQKC